MDIPTLSTKRLTLEPLTMTHSGGMFKLWSHPDVCQYSGVVRDMHGEIIETPVLKPDQSDRIISFWQNAIATGWGFRWAIIDTADKKFLGTIGFNSLNEHFEIAFHLHPEYWGQGIMSEAAEAAVTWAQSSNAVGLDAYIELENIASQKLAERLAMHATGEYSEGAERYTLSF